MRGVPKAASVGRVEIGSERIDVIAVAGFIANSVLQFEQRDPLLKVGENHLGGCRRSHLGVRPVAVGEGISPRRDHLDPSGIPRCEADVSPRDRKLVHLINGASTEVGTPREDPLFCVADFTLRAEEIPFGAPVLTDVVKVKRNHVLGRETQDLVTVIGSEVGLSLVEVHGVWLHEVDGQVG